MRLNSWLSIFSKSPSRRKLKVAKAQRRAILDLPEVLEDRMLLTTFLVDDDFTGAIPGFGVTHFASIQLAINAANAGGGDTVSVAAGTYNENITVDRQLTLDGAGSGVTAADTIINGSGTSAVTITGSGLSAANRLVIQDLRIQGTALYSVNIGTSVSFVTLKNVAGDGSANAQAYGIALHGNINVNDLLLDGIKYSNFFNGAIQVGGTTVPGIPTVNGFTLQNSELSHNRFGLHTYADSTATNNQTRFTNVLIQDTLILDNGWKGMYFETLDHAVIQRVTVQDSGLMAPAGNSNGNGNSGIELNLKYGSFSSVQILNNTFDHSGIRTGPGPNDVSAALGIKPRNQGSYALNPASLDNVVVSGNTFTDLNDPSVLFTGIGRAILIGETGSPPTGIPTNMTISNNLLTDGTFPGLVNTTASTVNASGNYWGDPDEADLTGDLSGNVDYSPWLTTSTDTSAAPGFQGDNSNLGVSSTSPGATSLQEAIDAAAPGSTLILVAGTYSEASINVNKALTFSLPSGTASFTGTLILGDDVTFNVAAGASLTLSGQVTGAAGNDLTKTGAGTLVLTNANNTYSGATNVNAGTLLVNGENNGTGAFNVNSSAILGGSGGIDGAVNVNATGHLAPGNSPDTINTGTLTLTAMSVFDVELNGTSPGDGVTGYDQVNVTGAVNLAGTLNVTVGYAAAIGDRYLIISNDGADAVTGTFAGLPEGAIVTVSGHRFSISYVDTVLGDGNDVSLVKVPVPVTYNYSNGNLAITGTDLADDFEIVVTGTNQVTLVGNSLTNFQGNVANGFTVGPFNVTGNLAISTFAGSDRVLLRGAGGAAVVDSGNITIDLGAGDDVFTTVDTIAPITLTTGLTMTGDLSVLGGAGNDTITLGSAAAADTFAATSVTLDTGAGVAQSVSVDRATIGTNLTIKNSGTGAQTAAVGVNGASTVGRDLIITQAAGATGYDVDVRNTGVGRNLQITNGAGTGAASVTVDTTAAPPRVVGGTTFIQNGNNASNAVTLDGTTGGLRLTGNVTVLNGSATTTNAITVTNVNDSGTNSASFTNGNATSNSITFNGTVSNTFLGNVSAANGVATGGSNSILASRLAARGLTLTNGVSTVSNAITLGGATTVVVNGNVSLTNGAAPDIAVNIDRLTTTVPSGDVTISNGASGAGGTDVVIGTVGVLNTIAGKLSIANQASTGARLVSINNATVSGGGGLSINNAGGGNNTLNIGTTALVTVSKKLDIQDGSGNATATINTASVGSLTYNDLNGGTDLINLAAAGTFQNSGVTRLNLGNGSDEVNIAIGGSAVFNDSVFVSLGSGNDELNIGPTASGPAFSAANKFQFNGDAGIDTIAVSPLAIADYTVGTVPKKLKSKITGFETIS